MFQLFFEKKVKDDIQQTVNFYNSKRKGQGAKFKKILWNHFGSIQKNPFYWVRRDNIRCLPVKGYPYLIHFIVDEANEKVRIFAVFHTSQENPFLK